MYRWYHDKGKAFSHSAVLVVPESSRVCERDTEMKWSNSWQPQYTSFVTITTFCHMPRIKLVADLWEFLSHNFSYGWGPVRGDEVNAEALCVQQTIESPPKALWLHGNRTAGFSHLHSDKGQMRKIITQWAITSLSFPPTKSLIQLWNLPVVTQNEWSRLLIVAGRSMLSIWSCDL